MQKIFLFLFVALFLVGALPAETLTIDFSKYDATATEPKPLVGQHGWQASAKRSPGVGVLDWNDREVKVVRGVIRRDETGKGEPCMALLKVDYRVPENAGIVVVESEVMIDGFPDGQVAMAGFGKGGPAQFGVDLNGRVGVRSDQWKTIYPARNSGGGHFALEYGLWYRFRFEIDPKADDGKGIGRLLLRPLTGTDPRFPKDEWIAMVFEVNGKPTDRVPLELRYPADQWDTVWLRTSNSDNRGEGGFLARIAVSTAEAFTPVSAKAFLEEEAVTPVRTAEETERLLNLSKSDVLLSSRWARPINKNDKHDTMKAVADFHATRMEWSYADNPEFIRKVKSKLKTFAGSTNTIFLQGKKYADDPQPGHVVTRDGKIVAAPWMLVFNGWWGCPNSKEYRDDYVARTDRLIEAGADSIHMDDPGLNLAAIAWGGCFCPNCVTGFREYLKKQTLSEHAKKRIGNPDTYDIRNASGVENAFAMRLFRDYQKESVQKFYDEMRAHMRRKAGRDILFSTNNYGGNWAFPSDLSDFGVAEINEKSTVPLHLFTVIERARKLGKVQIFTMAFRDVTTNRRGYATMYACGGHAILPWDVYIPPSESPRLFLTPEQFADLSGFVRAMARYLDGYTTGSVAGAELDAISRGEIAVSENDTLCAFVRHPESGPGVVHLVSWGEPKNAVLTLDPEKIWAGKKPNRVVLWKPAPYDRAEHDKAEKSGDYSSLTVSQIVDVRYDADGKAVLAVPRLDIWGIVAVVVE